MLQYSQELVERSGIDSVESMTSFSNRERIHQDTVAQLCQRLRLHITQVADSIFQNSYLSSKSLVGPGASRHHYDDIGGV